MTDMLPIHRSKAQARRNYDRISGIYDVLTASEKALIHQGLELLAVQPHEHILEIGCGTGSGLHHTLSSAEPPTSVIGLDLSHRMLLQSQQKNTPSPTPVLHIQGDGTHLPFCDTSFNVVFMSFTLELFSEQDIMLVLSECQRVLKPHGRLGVISLVTTPCTLSLGLYQLAHQLLPVAVDCRPIPLNHLLKSNGFTIDHAIQEKNWGLPIHLVVCSPPVNNHPTTAKQEA